MDPPTEAAGSLSVIVIASADGVNVDSALMELRGRLTSLVAAKKVEGRNSAENGSYLSRFSLGADYSGDCGHAAMPL